MVLIFVDKRIVRCSLKFEFVVLIPVLTHNFYDITEILFKVALTTITLTPLYRCICLSWCTKLHVMTIPTKSTKN